MKKIKSVIGPSILSADFANLYADCQNVLDCGADSLHIDIMDGYFWINQVISWTIYRLELLWLLLCEKKCQMYISTAI